MKSLHTILILSLIMVLASCGSDDDKDHDHDHGHHEDTTYEYHAHIHSPTDATMKMGDTISIRVNFESHTGETVHHINIILHKAEDEEAVVFSEPNDAHIHNVDGNFTYEYFYALTEENGIEGHTDYTLKASVWGAQEGEELVEETVTFHVHIK